jgi:hypothetical protein
MGPLARSRRDHSGRGPAAGTIQRPSQARTRIDITAAAPNQASQKNTGTQRAAGQPPTPSITPSRPSTARAYRRLRRVLTTPTVVKRSRPMPTQSSDTAKGTRVAR